jgi:hypothetical protein
MLVIAGAAIVGLSGIGSSSHDHVVRITATAAAREISFFMGFYFTDMTGQNWSTHVKATVLAF